MSSLDPIELQVIVGALRAACEEMGGALIRSAHSANIKERRDASTALFDRHGEMVMQAEHIPVHLGSMPAAVLVVLEREQRPGVSWVLNDPFEGGTHLPDITVVTPIFADAPRARGGHRVLRASKTPCDVLPQSPTEPSPTGPHPRGPLIGFAASRAHHADVGGLVPGSMPADSRTLEEEGVVIHPRELNEAAIEELVAQMRQPQERRADLRAQLAANRIGALRLSELAERVGVQRLATAMEEVLDYAERRTRACIAALTDGVREARDVLEASEGDLLLCLKATVAGEQLTLDFSGSAWRHRGNLNCPLAVTLSACWFAVRVLTDPDIPPSAGAYRPVEVIVPEGSLLNAKPLADSGEPAPAVAAGNVETSSRVADLVLGAFGKAQGQGTMNNLTLGNADFSYYETLGGGQGACEDRRRAQWRARGHEQHAEHAGRGARARVAAARQRVCAATRLGRSRQAQGRRRRRTRARGAQRHDFLADRRAPPPRALRRKRRRGRQAGSRHVDRGRWQATRIAGEDDG